MNYSVIFPICGIFIFCVGILGFLVVQYYLTQTSKLQMERYKIIGWIGLYGGLSSIGLVHVFEWHFTPQGDAMQLFGYVLLNTCGLVGIYHIIKSSWKRGKPHQ